MSSSSRLRLAFAAGIVVSLSGRTAAAQTDEEQPAEVTPEADAEPAPPPPSLVSEPEPEPAPVPRHRMSEGRRIVSAYNSGFQWALSPGVVFANGKTGFFLGLRFGYGLDTGSAIIVPGVHLAGYFTDPNVYIGMPSVKLVYPIDRFAPFIQGGAGVGQVATNPSQSGVALMGGGGFMLHFSWSFGLGVEASYQVITGTGFEGFGIGPILAIGF